MNVSQKNKVKTLKSLGQRSLAKITSIPLQKCKNNLLRLLRLEVMKQNSYISTLLLNSLEGMNSSKTTCAKIQTRMSSMQSSK